MACTTFNSVCIHCPATCTIAIYTCIMQMRTLHTTAASLYMYVRLSDCCEKILYTVKSLDSHNSNFTRNIYTCIHAYQRVYMSNVHVRCNHMYTTCTKTLQVMETTHHIYLVTEYASKGEIFGKKMYMYTPFPDLKCHSKHKCTM